MLDRRPVQAFVAGGKLGADQISTSERPQGNHIQTALATVAAGQKAENVRRVYERAGCASDRQTVRSSSTLTTTSPRATLPQISSRRLPATMPRPIRLTVRTHDFLMTTRS